MSSQSPGAELGVGESSAALTWAVIHLKAML